MSAEEWLPVPGYEGIYEVSSLGRVRSLDRWVRGKGDSIQLRAGRIMSPWKLGNYRAVDLQRDGKKKAVRVHSLVLAAFVGPRPEGMNGCHFDGDPTNNALSNLRYDTQSANILDAVRIGAHPNAAKTHCKRGHEFTPENTYGGPGRRHCRACVLKQRRAKESA